MHPINITIKINFILQMINFTRSAFAFSSIPMFTQYNLHGKIIEALNAKELYTPTPIQDLILSSKKDRFLMVAPTGTGKTISYVIPLLQQLKLKEEQAQTRLTQSNRIRGLVIVPTKDLATQVTSVFKDFTHYVKLRAVSLNHRSAKEALNEGVDIGVTTIQQLKNLQKSQLLFLTQLTYLVIDEFDTLIDSSADIEPLCSKSLKANININLVSATYTNKMKQFISQVLPDLPIIQEKRAHMHLENLKHEFIHVININKLPSLQGLIKELKSASIIFCNSIKSCQFVEYSLKELGIKVVTLHGDVPKNVREQNLRIFKNQEASILLTTDLGARGLDFPFVKNVINFDFPTTTSDYLHRAGRCGRAGQKGWVYSLYHSKDSKLINELKAANDDGKPIEIKGSAYSKINREIMKKQFKS